MPLPKTESERSEWTRQCWPTESREELVERIRREHGDDCADTVARFLLEPKQKNRKALVRGRRR